MRKLYDAMVMQEAHHLHINFAFLVTGWPGATAASSTTCSFPTPRQWGLDSQRSSTVTRKMRTRLRQGRAAAERTDSWAPMRSHSSHTLRNRQARKWLYLPLIKRRAGSSFLYRRKSPRTLNWRRQLATNTKRNQFRKKNRTREIQRQIGTAPLWCIPHRYFWWCHSFSLWCFLRNIAFVRPGVISRHGR